MSGMFYFADAFNGDISEWDVSSVWYMSYMFYGANSFNQDLSSWCVTNITSAPTNFGNAGTDPVWGTCPTTSNQLDEKPLVFGLDQNYPNPFNPSTTINYSIEEAGAVTINVYNAMGQKVATLVNEMKTVGNYTARWNAAGHASGMYYYRLQSNGQMITKKMTLVK
jgi:surface protein